MKIKMAKIISQIYKMFYIFFSIKLFKTELVPAYNFTKIH